MSSFLVGRDPVVSAVLPFVPQPPPAQLGNRLCLLITPLSFFSDVGLPGPDQLQLQSRLGGQEECHCLSHRCNTVLSGMVADDRHFGCIWKGKEKHLGLLTPVLRAIKECQWCNGVASWLVISRSAGSSSGWQ